VVLVACEFVVYARELWVLRAIKITEHRKSELRILRVWKITGMKETERRDREDEQFGWTVLAVNRSSHWLEFCLGE